MGLGHDQHTSKTYLNIVGGKIVKKVKEGTDGAVSRINKKGDEVWELQFDKLTGRIVDINLEPSEFRDVWSVTIQDGIDYYYLHLPISGRITNGLMHRLPNIDLSQDVILKVFRIFNTTKQKDQDYLVVYQGGEGKSNKIENFYTKETPNGLPQMKQIKVKGVPTWDDTDQIEFITQMVMTQIKPKLKGAPAAEYKEKSIKEIAQEKNAAIAEQLEDLSDLPF